MRYLVIGLGNPILGDDGVGWKVVIEVEARLHSPDQRALWVKVHADGFALECLSLAGISLMEKMTGYEHVILVDSLNTGRQPTGTVMVLNLANLEDLTYGHSASAHDVSLKSALAMGRTLGLDLPADEQIEIVAIEAAHCYEFTEELSPSVAAALPEAVKKVLNLLER